jgi:7-cyano-7-deazaguanine synthase in queuosine biosynthesis
VGPINDENLIWCGSSPLPASAKATYKKTVELNAYPKSGNVNLKYLDISSGLLRNLPPIAKDMLEIASYVYCADQAIRRGGLALRGDGVGWRRNLRFSIPVREIEIWNSPEVQKLLTGTLGFLSDDKYEFEFKKLAKDIPFEEFFDFHEETPFFEADEVVLFSGGLDSLAGAIDEMKNNDRKVVLVSHRPAGKIYARQRGLLWELKRLNEYQGKFLHVSVCINKDSGLTNDTNQRTRSFLYVMIAASVALMFKIDEIRFFENGVTSFNLPISEQLKGARASRTTHPKVLDGYSRLLPLLLRKNISVKNPYLWKTKSEVVQVLRDARLENLVKKSVSCSHVRTTDAVTTHCGTCYQCVDRRFATLYNDLEDDDPPKYIRPTYSPASSEPRMRKRWLNRTCDSPRMLKT